MDAFYASVEQRDFPQYRGKPLVVGGRPDSRGVVATASYEAREYGIRSAMSCSDAFKLCPFAIFVRPRFEVYADVSRKIREIFSRYTDIIEPLSLDEAFLDISVDKQNLGSAIEVAQSIKDAIKTELGLTASAGVSVNKFVAKIASDMNKPDGLTFIGPSKVESFMEKLPVEKFFGVGKVTAHKMKVMQIHTGGDLKKLTEEQMLHQFGKMGKFYFNIVRGIDNRPVRPHRETKSVSVEDTFHEDTNDLAVLSDFLKQLSEVLSSRLEKHKLMGRTVTLKIKYADFTIQTRSHSVATPIQMSADIFHESNILLRQADIKRNVRLLGISLSNFRIPVSPDSKNQLNLEL